jgi:FtsH ternary system domain X6
MSVFQVTEDEEPIIGLARELFAQAPEATLRARLETAHKTPARMTPEGMKVLEDTLAKGAALFVARHGAWRKERGARLWERQSPPELVFTGASFQFLRWMLGLGDRTELGTLLPQRERARSGDELLLVAALAATGGTPWQGAVAWQAMVRDSALCCVGFAAELGAVKALERVPELDLSRGSWHAFALEGLCELFTWQWAEAEAEKQRETLPARLHGASLAQAKVLEALFAAAKEPQARGSLTFLLEAGKRVLEAGLPPQGYGGALNPRSTLRERTEARQASAALLRGLQQLQALDATHRQTRFTDDGYELAQALVVRWEAAGPSPVQWATLEPTLSALGAA